MPPVLLWTVGIVASIPNWLGEDWPPHCLHWRECKQKPAPIFVLVDYKLSAIWTNIIRNQILKINNFQFQGFYHMGNEGVSSPCPPNCGWESPGHQNDEFIRLH
jgi:hypothetical protein